MLAQYLRLGELNPSAAHRRIEIFITTYNINQRRYIYTNSMLR